MSLLLMKTLTVKPVPVPEKYKHPDPPNDALMRHEFTLGLIGKFAANNKPQKEVFISLAYVSRKNHTYL